MIKEEYDKVAFKVAFLSFKSDAVRGLKSAEYKPRCFIRQVMQLYYFLFVTLIHYKYRMLGLFGLPKRPTANLKDKPAGQNILPKYDASAISNKMNASLYGIKE